MSHLIAITGGIGSGKSTVSQILLALGFSVYDCDSRAQSLIQQDLDIKKRIRSDIHRDAYLPNGEYNKKLVAEVVFSNSEKLKALNAIVHSAVTEDLRHWVNEQEGELIFVETAILYESGLDKLVDDVWEVTAPESLRIERVCKRSGLTQSQVRSRIQAQQKETKKSTSLHNIILNDNHHSLLFQVNELLQKSESSVSV